MVVDLAVSASSAAGPRYCGPARRRSAGNAQHSLNREALQQLVHLLIRHLFSELREDVSQFSGTDESIARLVKDLEPLDEFVLTSA